MELNLPPKLQKALQREADDARVSLHAHIVKKLESITPPIEAVDPAAVTGNLPALADFINRLPAVRAISHAATRDAFWWIKFEIDLEDALAWSVVQELGFVLNYISIHDRLPTVFKPVSPPPYLNGGPDENLTWVIESTYNYIDPKWILGELESRLPSPVDDRAQWER